MASILRMKRLIKENISKKIQSKKEFYSTNSFNDFNELSSKSLLANVLDISDDFGVLKKSKKKPNILSEQINNNYSPYPTGKVYLRRENSTFSQSALENTVEENKNDISSLRRNLNAILKELRCMTRKLKDDEEEEEESLNW